MGFWQGLNEGLTYVLDKKAAKESEEQDRAFKTKMYQQQLRDGRMDSLFKVALERGAFTQSASNNTHELNVLRQLGASDEVLEMVAGYSTESLQEAVTTLQEKRKAREGSPLTVGPAEVDAFLSTAVNTVSEGGDPDYNKAAALLGLDLEDLDKPFAGGMTYKDVLKGGLATPNTRKTTFLDTYTGKPLSTTDVNTIQEGAKANLADSLKANMAATAKVASMFTAKESVSTLTQAEEDEKKRINARMMALTDAEKDLEDRDSITAAIQLVGGQAIMPLIMNNPVALQYAFPAGWKSAIESYTFASEEDLQKAVDEQRVFRGDIVIVNGEVGTVANRVRTQ
jgi:hypothetical protein